MLKPLIGSWWKLGCTADKVTLDIQIKRQWCKPSKTRTAVIAIQTLGHNQSRAVQDLISKPVSTVWAWELELMSKHRYKMKWILWNQILSLLTTSSSLHVLTSPRKGSSATSIMGWLTTMNGSPIYSKMVLVVSHILGKTRKQVVIK